MMFSSLNFSPTTWLFLAILILLLFVIAQVHRARRACLHGIPGPFLARYTNAWRCFQAFMAPKYKGLENYQMRLLSEYGDVVRIGPKTVLVNDPDVARVVLGFKERLEKGPGYQAIAMSGTKQTALLAIRDEETHRNYRRPIAHAYSKSSLKGYEPQMDQTLDALVRSLDRIAERGEPTNMGEWLHYWAFDVISKISFGKALGFVERGCDFNGMIRSQKAAFRYFSVVSNMPILDQILKRNPVLNYFGLVKPSVFLTFGRQVVEERAQLLKETEKAQQMTDGLFLDMLGHFFDAKRKYSDIMTDQRISMYCLVNIVAGANNSALAMGKTMEYFANHPKSWEELRRGVDAAESLAHHTNDSEGPVALDLAFKVPYIEGVINESLRLMPTLSSNLERTVSAAGLTLPNGIWLPPGTNVAINQSAMTRRKDSFGEDALEFNPCRWTRGEADGKKEFDERRAKMNKAMLQFGYGSRACIGQHFVTLEMYKLWATLVRRYNFEFITPMQQRISVIGDPLPTRSRAPSYP